MNDDDEWVLPEGRVLVKCPECDYTIDVPYFKVGDDGYIRQHCERCALPAYERITARWSPFDDKTEGFIIEQSVASATRRIVRECESTGRTDINMAEVGAMIARETLHNTFNLMSAEREYLCAFEAIEARRSGGIDGGDSVVAPPDGGEPDRDGVDPA